MSFAFGDPIPLWDDLSEPLIIVLPSMGRMDRVFENEEAYLIEEIIPFVEERYRTLPCREGRAVGGISRGGVDAFYIALSHPELFSTVGGISAGNFDREPSIRMILESHDQEVYPLQFWLAYGRNEQYGITAQNRDLVKTLEELGFPHAYIEDDGDHFDVDAAEQRSFWVLKFISETLGGGVVSVELLDYITAAWGYIKYQ
jgi:enterochelin esterase-like enzyme